MVFDIQHALFLTLDFYLRKVQEFMQAVKEQGLCLTEPRRIVLPHSFTTDNGKLYFALSLLLALGEFYVATNPWRKYKRESLNRTPLFHFH